MAMVKFAKAKVVHPFISDGAWGHVRTAAARQGAKLSGNLVEQASEILGEEFSPSNYLLTHATIVASVDTVEVPNVRLGKVTEDGFKVNRRFADYRVKRESDKYINNNDDCWSRPVLLLSHKTFVGGQNYCFAPGTLVTMADGTVKPIEEVQVGDLVLTHTGAGQAVTHKFERPFAGDLHVLTWDRYKTPTFVTGNHPFRHLVTEDAPAQHRTGTSPRNAARYLTDRSAVTLRDGRATAVWTAAEDMPVGAFVAGASVQNLEVGDPSLEDLAVILGYYVAEGCQLVTTTSSEGSKGAVITPGSHEMAVVEDLAGRVRRAFPDTRIAVTPTQSSTFRVELRGAEIGAWLFRHGHQHAATKRLSQDVLGWDKEALRWLLASWLNGDGNLMGNTVRLRGSTVSRDLAFQMLRIADVLGVRASVTRTPSEKIQGSQVTLHVAGQPQTFRVVSNYDLWTLTISKESISIVASASLRWKDLASPSGRKCSDAAWWNGHRVHRVAAHQTQQYEGPVFNLEVAGDNSYTIAPGIAVHNCEHVQVEELSKGRIIDAVARDIGESVYTDILIATAKKHEDLVKAIKNGTMSTLSMGCFLPGTQVALSDGRRVAIEDVQPGDFVLTHKGRAREVLNKQIRGGVFGVQQIRAVGISSTITATDNHPFYVFRQPDICACGCGEALPARKRKDAPRGLARRFLRGHDKRIFNPNNTYSPAEAQERKARLESLTAWEMQKVRADELRAGDFLCFPRMLDMAEAGVSNGRARLLGYFLAEGSFLKRKGVPCETQFCFSRDEKDTLVTEVVSLLKQEFDLANDPWVQERLDRNTCTVHVSGKDVAAWFKAHGGEYGNRKRLSAEVMGWSAENHKHLLGAWLEGDGTLAKIGGNTSGTTTSYDLACQMHLLLARCGIFARLECRIGARIARVCEAVSSGFVRDPVSGRLPAFNLVVGNLQSQGLVGYTAKCCPSTTFEVQRARVRDDVVVFPIKSVQAKTYEGWVHNMEVDEDHTYVVEGVAVGNCTIDGSVCTKCGHWAADESEMCPHIKYEKGNKFYDANGNQHRVAELCGHHTIAPTGGVTFIEASWVATPAFTGAVLRNVIEATPEIGRKAQLVLSQPPREWVSGARQVAASRDHVASFQRTGQPVAIVGADRRMLADIIGQGFDDDMGDSGLGDEPAAPAAPAAPPKSPLDEATDDLVKTLTDRAVKKVRERMNDQDSGGTQSPPDESTNENLITQASIYRAGLTAITKTAANDAALVEGVALLNKQVGIEVPISIYRAALRVGAFQSGRDASQYLTACGRILGRQPTGAEARMLVRLGRLLDEGRKSTARGLENHRQHGG